MATDQDILSASLVLQDVLTYSTTPKKRSENAKMELGVESQIVQHYLFFGDFISKSRDEFNQRWQGTISPATFDGVICLATLGHGAFGKVLLVKKNEELYAAKMLEKRSIIKNDRLEHVCNEIRLMDALNFEFLVHLVEFLKSNCYIYIVMPFIIGGEMFQHLRHKGKFDEEQAKFYGSQVILSLEYMHGNGVIYRDLKPENIMINVDGYLKITDFGFCKKVDQHRTWSLCGTPEYLAPEIILNKGYNKSVDWWALGILIFEMVVGHPPFTAKEHMELYDKIVSGRFYYPPHVTPQLQNLLSNIIVVDKTKRYGVLKNGPRDVKGHSWFKTINWDAILAKTASAPYIPKIDSPTDIKHFHPFPHTDITDCEEDEYTLEFGAIGVKNAISRPKLFSHFLSRSNSSKKSIK